MPGTESAAHLFNNDGDQLPTSPSEDDYFAHGWAPSSDHQHQQSMSVITIVNDETQWYLSPKTHLDAVLVFLCILAFCSGVIGNLLCITAFFCRRRSCLTVDVGLMSIYFAVLFLLFRSLSSFHLQFMVVSSAQYREYQANKLMVCVLPYGYAAVHMAVFYTLTLIATLQYLNIAWPQYSLRPRHIVAVVVLIVAFCFLVNVHFLLVHCRAFEYELYIEYVKTVWLKFVFIDGSAFVIAFIFLLRTLMSIRSSPGHLPDRHLLRDDCLAVMLLLFVYSTPVFVDSLFALVELYSSDERLSLRTIHFDLVLTLHVISLASIPLVTATTRPATRLDVNNLFDRWRECSDSCFLRRRDGGAGGGGGGAVSFVQRLRLSLSSGGHTNGALSILGESADGATDDRLQILSVSPCYEDNNNIVAASNGSPIAPPPSYVFSNNSNGHHQLTNGGGFATFRDFHDDDVNGTGEHNNNRNTSSSSSR